MQSSADWKGLILSQGSKIEKQIARRYLTFPSKESKLDFAREGGNNEVIRRFNDDV